ncbi:hypothetical protein CEXT_389451 [Caerostris extrusa]|uniref:LAGLIDADG homing endonuclease n=1 Tax=Caerostris extrusa TaxID=172846 RepID=A0AAV4Q1P4_CAEEX|nr:hypothetical protein CEXT_389451 [Caerostris extrusa]
MLGYLNRVLGHAPQFRFKMDFKETKCFYTLLLILTRGRQSLRNSVRMGLSRALNLFSSVNSTKDQTKKNLPEAILSVYHTEENLSVFSLVKQFTVPPT